MQKHLNTSRRQRGFTITELMLVLGVGSLMIAGAFVGYKVLTDNQSSQENMTSTSNLTAAVKTKWQGIGSYAAVTTAAVGDAGLVSKPLSFDGTNITNVYGNNVDFVGAAANYVAQISVPTKYCTDTIGSIDGIAYRIDVDTAASAPGDAVDAAATVKAPGATINATKTDTQCSAAGDTKVITAFVH